jgi:antitoxin HicB
MTKRPRSTNGLTTLDDFPEGEGTREPFQAVAIKEVLAWRISEAMKTRGSRAGGPQGGDENQ